MAEVVAKYKLDVNDAVKNLDKLQSETKQLDNNLDKAGKDGSKSLEKVGKSTRNLGNKFKDLGKQILGALAIGSAVTSFVNAIRGAIQINKQFELQMARVQAITGATNKEFKLLSENAKRLGSSTKFTATQVGELQEEYAKLGFTTTEILNATEATLELAEATGGSLSEAANVAGQVLRSFGLDATETQRVVDVMAASFSKSALNISSFQESMKFAAPIARAAGIEIETVTALLGKLADAGLRGSIAGTGLKNLLSQLADENSDLGKEIGFGVKNTQDLFKAFNQLKNANIDLTKATELTDERSKAAFITLIEGIGSVEDLTKALKDSEGAASDMAKVVRDTLSGDVDKMKSAIEGLALALGEGEGGLAKAARIATQNWTMWINKLTEASLSTQQLIDQKADTYYEKYSTSILDSSESIDELITKQREKLVSSTEDAIALREQGRLTGDLLISRLGEIKGLQAIIALLEEKNVASKQDNEETDNGSESTDTYVRSIAQLNKELKSLQEEFKDAEIGSNAWYDAIEKVFNKTEELSDANEELELQLALLEGAFDNYESIETKGIDNFTESVKKASDALKKAKEEAQQASLALTDDVYIDPSQGYQSYAPDGEDSAVGSGLLSSDDDNYDEEIDKFIAYATAVKDISAGITSAIMAGHQNELDSLNQQLEAGQITREGYDKKRRELERKKAISEKNAAIFDAIISTAVGIAASLKIGAPLGPILAAVTAALGAVQIGVIASQPLPQFAEGGLVAEHGMLKGKTHAQGGIMIEAEKDEFFVNAKRTRENIGLLKAVNDGTVESFIISKYVRPMIDESLYKGFGDIGKSAKLNGITANLKDHNILHGLDRLRQSQTQGFHFLAKELKQSQPKRGGYRA